MKELRLLLIRSVEKKGQLQSSTLTRIKHFNRAIRFLITLNQFFSHSCLVLRGLGSYLHRYHTSALAAWADCAPLAAAAQVTVVLRLPVELAGLPPLVDGSWMKALESL